ncbi:hypothetical protein FA13DRAFT_1783682 [Coprinellus micaceus]|uniref:Uncharacterized protein n=1 Tax=Coprinellus micaceus TaxID=71717 RepID=A0A4Y7RBE7_COPMI|nr:hypothetical protein FA13DRAFT_1783682 [Coprinellus micaceus]
MYSSKQGPTISHLRVRTTKDAKKIFEAVLRGHLPMVTQRLDPDQRRQISSGQVYVWEERSSNRSRNSSSGIERWTDSISWGQSHVKDEFLFYDEKERADTVYPSSFVNGSSRILGWASRGLIKQTYSVYIKLPPGSPELFAKWHMTAYSTASTVDSLFTVDNHLYFPFLQSMEYPPDRYTSARGGGRMTPPALHQGQRPKSPVSRLWIFCADSPLMHAILWMRRQSCPSNL